MDFLRLKIGLLYLIVFTQCAVVKKRYKRNPTPPSPTLQSLELDLDSYHALLSDSIPQNCPSNLTRVSRRVSLSTEGLRSLLKDKGGTFLPHLMATEEDSANKKLLNVDTFSDEDMLDHILSTTKSPSHKSRLEEYLRKLSFISNFIQSANSLDGRNSTKPYYLRQGVRRPKFKGNDSSSNIIDLFISDFLVQNNLTLNQLMEYIKTMKVPTHPKILMALQQHKDRRIKRNADGSKTIIQYCKKKGEQIRGSFLRLCDECAVTTKLSTDTFPKVLNEVICGSDSTCLSLKGTHGSKPQGACIQSELHVKLLRRRPHSYCRLMNTDGQIVNLPQWEPYTQVVRTGCQCAINKLSYLRNSVDLTVPIG